MLVLFIFFSLNVLGYFDPNEAYTFRILYYSWGGSNDMDGIE